MDKLKIQEAVVVEGRYDAHLLCSIVDTVVLETGGYSVFNDKKLQQLVAMYAEKRGVIILTDSDGAGLVIRNGLKGALRGGRVLHAYIPQLCGKERRKDKPSAAGYLGVEGMDPEVIKRALIHAGATVCGGESAEKSGITKAMLYEDGLYGRADSAIKRVRLQRELGLPDNISANALVEALGTMCGMDEYKELINKLFGEK